MTWEAMFLWASPVPGKGIYMVLHVRERDSWQASYARHTVAANGEPAATETLVGEGFYGSQEQAIAACEQDCRTREGRVAVG